MEVPGKEDEEEGEINVVTDKNEDWQDNGMESDDEVIALEALRTLTINCVEKEMKSMADVR